MATPTVRRLQLGNEMRHVRIKAGREQAEAAGALDAGIGKISRLELGQGGISKGDLKLLLEFYEVDPGEMQWMFELAKTRSSRGRWGDSLRYPAWVHSRRDRGLRRYDRSRQHERGQEGRQVPARR